MAIHLSSSQGVLTKAQQGVDQAKGRVAGKRKALEAQASGIQVAASEHPQKKWPSRWILSIQALIQIIVMSRSNV